MLAAPGIEGLLYIDRTSVDYTELSTDKVAAHLLSTDPFLDVAGLSTQSMIDSFNSVYTTREAHTQPARAPDVRTFIEARFWIMCGVKFDGVVALVSYDSLEIKWDESSYEKENGIRHYAKAVGAGMRTSLSENSTSTARTYE
jgi:hypothetical protein